MIRKWPLHPKPYEYQLLCNWIEKLAEIYGVSYKSFCKNVLGLTYEETSTLRTSLPEKILVILANGTGIPITDLSTRNLPGIFEKLKRVIDKEIEENPDAFASLFQRWEIKP